MEKITLPPPTRIPRLRLRQSTLTTIAAIGGIVVLTLLTLTTAEKRLHQMRIETAFVTQPMEPIVATDGGTLKQVYVQEGEKVAAGTPLVQVERDLEIQAEMARLEGLILAQSRERLRLQEQRITLEREQQQAQVNLATARAATQLEQQQLPARSAIEQSRIDAARSEVEALAQQLEIAQTRRDRFAELLTHGATSQVAYDETVAEVARLQGAWQTAQENLTIAATVLEGTQQGDFVERGQLQGQLPTLQLQQTQAQEHLGVITHQVRSLKTLLEDLEQELATLQTRHDQLLSRQALGPELAKVYTAPVEGIVMTVPRSPGNSVNRGAALVVLQHQEGIPQIMVYLTQAQAQQLAVEEPAQVYDPITGNEYFADVTTLDWTGGKVEGIVDPFAPTYTVNPVGPGTISAPQPVLIHLTLQQENLEIPNGSPVVVTLKKQQDLLQRVGQVFQFRNLG
ncbi:MAG: hypothetical protein AAGE59_20845 [Cyanobacteria bacterium P01_F01_bin.86]